MALTQQQLQQMNQITGLSGGAGVSQQPVDRPAVPQQDDTGIQTAGAVGSSIGNVLGTLVPGLDLTGIPEEALGSVLGGLTQGGAALLSGRGFTGPQGALSEGGQGMAYGAIPMGGESRLLTLGGRMAGKGFANVAGRTLMRGVTGLGGAETAKAIQNVAGGQPIDQNLAGTGLLSGALNMVAPGVGKILGSLGSAAGRMAQGEAGAKIPQLVKATGQRFIGKNVQDTARNMAGILGSRLDNLLAQSGIGKEGSFVSNLLKDPAIKERAGITAADVPAVAGKRSSKSWSNIKSIMNETYNNTLDKYVKDNFNQVITHMIKAGSGKLAPSDLQTMQKVIAEKDPTTLAEFLKNRTDLQLPMAFWRKLKGAYQDLVPYPSEGKVDITKLSPTSKAAHYLQGKIRSMMAQEVSDKLSKTGVKITPEQIHTLNDLLGSATAMSKGGSKRFGMHSWIPNIAAPAALMGGVILGPTVGSAMSGKPAPPLNSTELGYLGLASLMNDRVGTTASSALSSDIPKVLQQLGVRLQPNQGISSQ